MNTIFVVVLVFTGGFDFQFRRGDVNCDGRIDISDPIFLQNWFFNGGPAPGCLDAADVNDDGKNDIADQVYLNNYLFYGGPPPPAPWPSCGSDQSSDNLSCSNYCGC